MTITATVFPINAATAFDAAGSAETVESALFDVGDPFPLPCRGLYEAHHLLVVSTRPVHFCHRPKITYCTSTTSEDCYICL